VGGDRRGRGSAAVRAGRVFGHLGHLGHLGHVGYVDGGPEPGGRHESREPVGGPDTRRDPPIDADRDENAGTHGHAGVDHRPRLT